MLCCIVYERKRFLDPRRGYSFLKYKCKRKGYDLDMTRDEYINIVKDKPCFYCERNFEEIGVNLDRIDSSKGYLKENVVVCCGECNRIKSDKYTMEEMKKIAKVLRKL